MTARVAIVGRAATTALGGDLVATWEAFRAGRSALAPWPSTAGWAPHVPHVARFVARHGAEGRAAPSAGGEDATERVLGRHGAWLERAMRAAHDAAGFASLPREELGLYVGFGMVDTAPEDVAAAVVASRDERGAFELERFYAGGFRAMHPLWPLSMLANVAAGHLAIALDLRGDNTVLGSDAVAGVRVLLEARRALNTGAATAALVGAVSEPVTEATLARRRLRGAPLGAHARDGAGPGEGAGALALETAASVRARAAHVHAWLAGAATVAARRPSGGVASAGGAPEAAREALALALADAGLGLEALDLVVLVGPWALPGAGAILREPRDARGLIGDLLRMPVPRVVSTAAALGDLLGAGPLVGAALALEILAGGEVPAARTTWVEADGAPPRPLPPPPRRVLVLSHDTDGSGALILEAPACAS